VFRPLHAPGATGGEPGLKQQQQQQQKQQQQQPGLRTAKLGEETQPRATDAAAAAAAKAAGSRGLPLNAQQQQQQEQPQPPAPRFFAAMEKKEESLPAFSSASAEAKDSIAGSSSSSSSLPSSSSAVPPRQLQQTIDHLAKRAPAPLEPKVIRLVSKKEGSAWAEKTTKKEGRAFSKFGGEGKKATAEEEEEEEEEKGGEKVGVKVDAEGKLTAAVTEKQEKMMKKKGRGPIGAVGDFLFGKKGGKAQGTKEDEVEEREEQGREKQKVWGSRISSNGAVMTKEEMEAERAAAAAAAEELAASRVEKEGKEEMEKGMEAGEESAAVGAKWMRQGHMGEIEKTEEGETHESIDKKLRQGKDGGEAQGQAPPSKNVFV